MAHHAFLHALVRTDPESAEGKNLMAGFLALRQFEIWIDNPGLISEANIAATIKKIRLAEPHVSRLLTAAVRGLVREKDTNKAVGPYAAYAYMLTVFFHKSLAHDAFTVVIDALEASNDYVDPWVSSFSYANRAWTHMSVGNWAAASNDLASARHFVKPYQGEVAEGHELFVQCTEGTALSMTGNLAAAQAKFTRIIERRGIEEQHPQILQRALTSRAQVHLNERNHDHALRDVIRAAPLVESSQMAQQIIGDVASILLEAGQAHIAALDIQRYLAKHALSPLQRSNCIANVIESYATLANEFGIADPREQIEYWWSEFRAAWHPIPSFELEGMFLYGRAVERWDSRKRALAIYQEVAHRASVKGFYAVARQARTSAQKALARQ